MESNGPLFHRNGAHTLTGWLSRVIMALVSLAGVAVLVLGITSVIR